MPRYYFRDVLMGSIGGYLIGTSAFSHPVHGGEDALWILVGGALMVLGAFVPRFIR